MSQYELLARYYDALIGDPVATVRWVRWVESFQPRKRFLELACGSGEITRLLAGYHDVDALDLSPHMISIAKNKDTEQKINFQVGDMRDLSGYEKYDAIGCFCDSINYILDPAEMEALFRDVAEHLNEGGLFFFDMHTPDRLSEFEEEYVETGQFHDSTQMQWTIASEDDFLFQDFIFYTPAGTFQEHHLQKVYDPKWIIEALQKYFSILSIKTDLSLEGMRSGEKYFFVCQKESA